MLIFEGFSTFFTTFVLLLLGRKQGSHCRILVNYQINTRSGCINLMNDCTRLRRHCRILRENKINLRKGCTKLRNNCTMRRRHCKMSRNDQINLGSGCTNLRNDCTMLRNRCRRMRNDKIKLRWCGQVNYFPLPNFLNFHPPSFSQLLSFPSS